MLKLLKPLFAAVAVLVCLPTPASALPLDCDQVCDCYTPCDIVCARPGTMKVIRCGQWDAATCGSCVHSSDPQASVKAEKDSGEQELTCREPEKDAQG
ncbi:hypothetical protein [Stigmatella aurantiaca]|uniref:Uncharacterized protein n=1 Tax=Stigmatella aurantiaca (strain DW4/3-1) TaxID=378806 RepID=E3FH30_STIAD|nr:hypothetical protein [Stigmatella aurantiaca]ADO74060.1 uncharacterized protein STAUR_6303 [Stigmatella aurantiaca DW4/3-1]